MLETIRLKNIFKVFSTDNVPHEYKREFNAELVDTNYTRSRNLSILLLIVFILLLFLDYQNYVEGLWVEVPGYILLFYSHLVMFLGNALLITYLLAVKVKSESSLTLQRKVFIIAFSYLNVIGAAFVSAADQYIHAEITVFVLCALTFAILNYQKPLINLGMFGTAYVVFMVGISITQSNSEVLRGHYINGTVLVVLAFFLSAILYFAWVKDFLSRKTIQQHKEELEQTNEELIASNNELQESLQALDESQNMIFTLTLTLESKDSNTHGHSERVAEYVTALADQLALNENDKTNLWRAAILHDIGKIGIPDIILNKPSALNEEEWEVMRSHPSRGESICSKLKFAREILPIIRHHHERYDGTGYPDRLRGEAIPYLARIVSVADTVDAMTSPRTYRQPVSVEQTIEELKRCSGTQFDPVIVQAFIEMYESGKLPPKASSSLEKKK